MELLCSFTVNISHTLKEQNIAQVLLIKDIRQFKVQMKCFL